MVDDIGDDTDDDLEGDMKVDAGRAGSWRVVLTPFLVSLLPVDGDFITPIVECRAADDLLNDDDDDEEGDESLSFVSILPRYESLPAD